MSAAAVAPASRPSRSPRARRAGPSCAADVKKTTAVLGVEAEPGPPRAATPQGRQRQLRRFRTRRHTIGAAGSGGGLPVVGAGRLLVHPPLGLRKVRGGAGELVRESVPLLQCPQLVRTEVPTPPFSGRCRRWTSSGGRRRLWYAASGSPLSARGAARDGWFGGPGRECLPMVSMVSDRNRRRPRCPDIRHAGADLVHCSGAAAGLAPPHHSFQSNLISPGQPTRF